MKRKPTIPQFEFGFTSEAFNLAGQSEKPMPSTAPRIFAEMTPEERESAREESKRVPGLRPGSSWSVPDTAMRKALATMQGNL